MINLLTELSPGSVCGSYEIIRLLGKGGMGEVYEALEVSTSRRIALKIFSHSIQSNEARHHFLQEECISINHPNSVYIFGTEEIDPASRDHDGARQRWKSKRTRGEREPLKYGRRNRPYHTGHRWFRCLTHQGILHRDIKPSNIFVDQDGLLVVITGLSISTLEHEKVHPKEGETKL